MENEIWKDVEEFEIINYSGTPQEKSHLEKIKK